MDLCDRGIEGSGKLIKAAREHQLDLDRPEWIVADAAPRHDSVRLCDPVLLAELSIPCCGIWNRVSWMK